MTKKKKKKMTPVDCFQFPWKWPLEQVQLLFFIEKLKRK